MQKNSIIFSLLVSISACANQTITEIHLHRQFTKESSNVKDFELISVYQFHNSEQFPWLYELSGLAWDYDEQVLYSVTDSGYLIVLKPSFEDNKLIALNILRHFQLKNFNDEPLQEIFSDSEGLALRNHNNSIQGDTELAISFERKPRIDLYTNTGVFLKQILDFKHQFKIYEFSSSNKQLESLTELNEKNYVYGSERPLKQSLPGEIRLFDISNTIGTFRLHDKKYGSLVGLTTLPNNSLIALERVFVNVFTPLQFHIHKIELTEEGVKQQLLHSSTKEYEIISDNFEGISHHKDNYFFMVSDDNQNSILRTLLIYFRLPNLNVK